MNLDNEGPLYIPKGIIIVWHLIFLLKLYPITYSKAMYRRYESPYDQMTNGCEGFGQCKLIVPLIHSCIQRYTHEICKKLYIGGPIK